MPRISLRGVVFEHGGHGPFPIPFDLDLEPGWTGVVGANGVGKTTLLRLLSGQLACARGSIRREHGPEIAVLEQTVDWSPALARQLARLEQEVAGAGGSKPDGGEALLTALASTAVVPVLALGLLAICALLAAKLMRPVGE